MESISVLLLLSLRPDNLTCIKVIPGLLKRVVDQFKAKYQKVENENEQDPLLYAMDHTASLYLMVPDGRFITKFANGITTEVLAEEIAAIIR